LNGSDKRLFDGFTFVLGIFLGALCATVAVVTANLLDHSAPAVVSEEHEVLALEDRLAPVGKVLLLGDTALVALPAPAAVAPPRDTVLSGPQVFNEACNLCHSPPGVPGAPAIGDAAAWEARVAQGLATLQEHALNGYQGAAGLMPPKGGRIDLSDDEVRSAVVYMLDQLPKPGP
jgi:cytochrome c5